MVQNASALLLLLQAGLLRSHIAKRFATVVPCLERNKKKDLKDIHFCITFLYKFTLRARAVLFGGGVHAEGALMRNKNTKRGESEAWPSCLASFSFSEKMLSFFRKNVQSFISVCPYIQIRSIDPPLILTTSGTPCTIHVRQVQSHAILHQARWRVENHHT